jgi:hypothetical protein
MRNTIILLFALFAGTVFAQAPVIDSMLIDESKGILSVYGDFGAAKGKVWCDSVELPVLSWSDTLVTATIPDTGKGSAGGVVVEDIGGVSSTRLISQWKGSISETHFLHASRDALTQKSFGFTLRLDLSSLLQTGGVRTTKVNSLTKQFALEDRHAPYDPIYGYEVSWELKSSVYVNNADTVHTKGFTCTAEFSVPSKIILFKIKDIKGLIGNISGSSNSSQYEYSINDYTTGISLDSFYNIISYYYRQDKGNYSYDEFSRGGAQIFVPYKTIAIKYNPSIIAPKDDRDNLGTDDILLQWNALKYMDAYHVQLSKDSLVNGQKSGQEQQSITFVVDTIVTSLDFQLPHLEKSTKYYWRVCGVNTEGESRWSDVWSFTTGTSTDVKQEQAKSISLACYPNPATSELTIVTTEPTRLLLYDVTGKIVKSEQATSGETKWDVSLLPNGTYILGTSSGQMQVVQIVK